MKRHTAQWVSKAEEDREAARELAAHRPPRRNAACFHCQQAVEKYLKALLQELSISFSKTHDLELLLDLLLPHASTLNALRRRLDALTNFAVDYRYPLVRATRRQMQAALRTMERARRELRAWLGVPP